SWRGRERRCRGGRRFHTLLKGDGATALPTPIARGARLLSHRYPPEERSIGLVEQGEHLLQTVGKDGRVLRECPANGIELGFLLKAGGAHSLPSPPPGAALLQPTFRTPIGHFWELSISQATPRSIGVCSSHTPAVLARPVLDTWRATVPILGDSRETR